MAEIREATAADNDALIDLELQSPLDLGDHSIVFDRSPNFFAHQQMQEHGRVLLAREAALAVVAGAWHTSIDQRRRRPIRYQGRRAPRRGHAAGNNLPSKDGAKSGSSAGQRYLACPAPDCGQAWPSSRIDGFDVTGRVPTTRRSTRWAHPTSACSNSST
jgi:hypothetical protein